MDLTIDSVELVTSARPVPKHGAPDSSDFNAFQTEVLADLAELADCINESLLPVLRGLPDTAAEGLDGAALLAGRNNTGPLFRDSNGTLLTVADSLTSLFDLQTLAGQSLADLSARVLSLQSRLSSTSQNDLRASVQALQEAYTVLYNRTSQLLADVAAQRTALSKTRLASIDIEAGPAGTRSVEALFATPFADNNYVVSLAMETQGGLSASGFAKLDNGAGISVQVLSDATLPTGVLHVTAQAL